MNVVHHLGRQHNRFRAAVWIQALEAAPETEHLPNAIGVMQFKEERADDIVHPGAQAATSNDTCPCLLGIKKDLFARSGKLKEQFSRRRELQVPHDLFGYAQSVADRASDRGKQPAFAETVILILATRSDWDRSGPSGRSLERA
jgi:hypothetical protein